MASNAFIAPRFLALMVFSGMLGTAVYAQSTAPEDGIGKAATTVYRSAFEGYRAYADEPVADWKEANDTAARIGGWREYARQAQSEEATPPRSDAAGAQPGSNSTVKTKP